MRTENKRQGEDNKREYSRVYAMLPFASRICSPEEQPLPQAKLFGEPLYSEFSTLPEIGDAHLSVWLKTINTKLDAIMRMIAIYQGGFEALPSKPVTISANGMDFFADADAAVGTLMEVKIILFSLPPVAVQLYGEVRSSVKSGNQHRLALRFLDMDDHIRNEIVRFVFEKEREILRAKRGEKEFL
ncbi:MAG: PilZ domain-containing protein [Syntrophales bacterium]|jgi:hypothetical protein|nr:PilZ domain-containing protein [Syntrophales bacterium]NLN59586.1 PilZ domain-containing protein [Deltaproteobacteria bacterium]